MKVGFTPAAVSQLAGISAYLRDYKPSAAARVADALKAAADSLARTPYMGSKQDVAGVRKKVVTSTRYFICYTVLTTEPTVRILAIVHASQRRRYSDA